MLRIENLTKTYGDVCAIDRLTLDIAPGEICALVGNEGAGKTTLIQLVCGITKFDAGDVFIEGLSMREEPFACKSRITYVPGSPIMYEFMSGIKYLNFIADIHGITVDTRQERIRKYSGIFGPTEDLSLPISSFSRGIRQKLALVSAFIYEPKLMALDEPFFDLDPYAASVLRTWMREICAFGGAFLFSASRREDVEGFYDKAAIIDNGRIVHWL